MLVQPYLSFEGRCEEAVEFYKQAVGAEVQVLMRFNQSPDACPEGILPPGSESKVMHSSLKIGDSIIMATDGNNTGKPNFQGISLSLSVANDAEATRLFNALAEGGQVQMPLTKTFFASSFGMIADRFGVVWMIVAPIPLPA